MPRLEKELWKLILENVPIATVDAVITRKNKYHQFEYLLGKRTQNPEKGMYGVIGGTIYKGENFQEALKRNLEREAKITEFTYRFVACDNLFANISEAGPGFHAVDHIFEIQTEQIPKTTIENNKFKWFSNIFDKRISPNARRMLKYVEDEYIYKRILV